MMRAAISTTVLAAILATGAARADVTISAKPTKHMNCAAGVCSPTAANAVLNSTDLANMLASGDVKVTTGSGATNIVVKETLSWTSTSRLTLDAIQSVEIDKPVMVTGTGAMTITTNDGGSGGDLVFGDTGNVTFWDLSSSLIVNGNGYTLVGDIDTLAADIAVNPFGFFALANNYRVKHAYHNAPIQTFSGTLEGLGHTIDKLTITHAHARDLLGLFRQIFEGTIRDLGLEDTNITGSGRIAGVLSALAIGATVSGCHASGSISLTEASVIGGLLGESDINSAVDRSTASVDIAAPDAQDWQGTHSAVGGLIGISDARVTQSYANGNVIGGEKTRVGGLIGSVALTSTIENSYALGSVSGGTSAHSGGLFGDLSDARILTSYSTGLVTGGKDNTRGGFVGSASDSQFTDNYWDIDTSGNERGHGSCHGDSECQTDIHGLTTEQITSSLPDGFDPAIWGQNPAINSGYPYLINNPPR